MTGIQFDPVDTLFFRTGTPFAMGDDAQEDVAGVFPPHPPSVAGAARVAWALANGWNGRSRWPAALVEVLGSGPDDLGRFAMWGPFVLRQGRVLFPAPRHLLGSAVGKQWQPRALLRPGRTVCCDLGEAVRLPEHAPSGDEVDLPGPPDGWWLSRKGMAAVLREELPATADLVAGASLWAREPRIGLQRETATRTAREGMVYSTQHVRLQPDVSLGVITCGVPESWSKPHGQVVPLGGESRVAELRPWDGDTRLEMPIERITSSGKLSVVALTPLDLDAAVVLGRRALAELGGAVVISACLGRAQRIGGWDSLARRPLPLRSVLPAGSVLFCEMREPGRLEAAIVGGELPRIGERTNQGFGLVALGTWTDASREVCK
ncbi:MAG: hypothetical protein IT457_20440 [Planctomycetes bacterium]|nr:hypothetical protein [Planctomycetota bacterium]